MATVTHFVICPYCKQRFNRDKEPTVQVSAKRYAHKECAEKYEASKSQEERDLETLKEYINKLFNNNYDHAKVQRQLKEYKEKYNYSYSGILKTLVYWYEIKENSLEKANSGIGIVPYIYEQSMQYYYNLYLTQMVNENKNLQDYQTKIKQVEIPPPKSFKPNFKFFHFLDEEEDE
jgi:hypothetical protein